ncbi:hypothetical protein ACJZ2D_004819 [Fusarium nematophilum]
MTVLILPKSLPSKEEFNLLVTKYKAFRLLSLELSPESFGSTLARETAFPHDAWVSRVSNPLATNIIAISDPDSGGVLSDPDEVELMLKEEWLASLTLIGPFDKESAAKRFKSDFYLDPEVVLDAEATWHFVLNAMYVRPSGRGQGLGSRLVAHANRVASELASGNKTRVLLVVDYDNESARRTYEKGGLVIMQRYWFDDYREGRSERTEAAVMKVDLNC